MANAIFVSNSRNCAKNCWRLSEVSCLNVSEPINLLKKLARALKVKPSELQSTNKADTAEIVEAPAVSTIDILPHCKLYFQRLLLNSGNAFMIAAHPDIAIAEKLEPVAAVTLGVIHSGIGFLGQCFQILGILGVYGDTYACG